MMREIKFRAWDEGNKVMHNDFQFFTSGEAGNDWICFSSDKEKRNTTNPAGIVFNDPYFRQQLKIMQFTGLRDKNGKEIYEGDILTDYAGGKYKVVWKDHLAGFLGEYSSGKDFYLEAFLTRESEVIGNIYETPEHLVEVK